MAKTAYSIRKGFEYQDLYCARALLEVLELGQLSATFQIESDEVDHIDDMVLRVDGAPPAANQVKFHTTLDHTETFDSLMHRKERQAKSLLEKLFKGWRQLSRNGQDDCSITFVSSNGVARGRYTLGTAIDTATLRLGTRFFSGADYKKSKAEIVKHLKASEHDAELFLKSMIWRFAYESIDSLRRAIELGMRRINFPADDAAVAQLMIAVEHFATKVEGESSLLDFVQFLWKSSRLRDACEQRFPGVVWESAAKRRANHVRIALIKLDYLPAYSGTRAVCLEEPIPLDGYQKGLTVSGLATTLSDSRHQWREEYSAWNLQRVQAILDALVDRGIDVLVFPRFSLDLEAACMVAQWCHLNACNAVLGGHSLPLTSAKLANYESDLGVSIDWQDRNQEELEDRVIDVVVRNGRGGMASISQMQSPFDKNERLEETPVSIDLPCQDGWITAVSLPSVSAIDDYLKAGGHAPELVIVSASIHVEPILHRIQETQNLASGPVALCTTSLNVPAWVRVGVDAGRASTGDGWEGIATYNIAYERSVGKGWTAEAESISTIPLVYSASDLNEAGADKDVWVSSLCGSAISRAEASKVLNDEPVNWARNLVVVKASDSDSLFINRARQAEEALREAFAKATTDQMRLMIAAIESISTAREARERSPSRTQVYAVPAAHVSAPRPLSFIDRADERRVLAKFVEGSTEKRLLIVHGAPGIGKHSLLNEVQRLDQAANNWVRFRCVRDTLLSEFFGQLMLRLGFPQTDPVPVELATYETLCQRIVEKNCRVLVLDEAHNLPLDQSQNEHADLLEFLSFFCRSALRPAPRIILVSNRRGYLNFSGSHLLEPVSLDGLEQPFMLNLLQELVAVSTSRYPAPTVSELEAIAEKTHGHPYIGQLAIAALENSPAAEVIQKLHHREEVRNFVINRLLGRTTLSRVESLFLQLAAVFRVPVLGSAFVEVAGAQSTQIIAELVNRFLLSADGDRFRLHPLVSDYFRAQIGTAEEMKQLHNKAYNYFAGLQRVRSLTLDEKVESVYHAFSSEKSVNFEDLRLFSGPIRSSMFDALRERDWAKVKSAASQILRIFQHEAAAKVAYAVALDATGESGEAEKYNDSIQQLDADHIWVAIEYAKSAIRRRDYDNAERILGELEHRFGARNAIHLSWAQLLESRGESGQALERCIAILSDPRCRQPDAFSAGLILRDIGHLDYLIEHIDAKSSGYLSHLGLQRLYAYAQVLTETAPDEGLQALAELWSAAPTDGYMIAYYAAAMSMMDQTEEARELFEQGLKDCKGNRKDKLALMEEYSQFLLHIGETSKGLEAYRDLLRAFPYSLHNRRRFAQALLNTARDASYDSNRPLEDSCIHEAEQVVRKLLEIAPKDQWATSMLHNIQHRIYQ